MSEKFKDVKYLNWKRLLGLNGFAVLIGFAISQIFDFNAREMTLFSQVTFIVSSLLYCTTSFSILFYYNLFSKVKNLFILRKLQFSIFKVQMEAFVQCVICAVFLLLVIIFENTGINRIFSCVSSFLNIVSLFNFTMYILWIHTNAQDLKDKIDNEKNSLI